MKKVLGLVVVLALGFGFAFAACDSGGSDDKEVADNPDVVIPDDDVKDNGDVPFVDDVCTPKCDGKECGDDGCGGSCGACAPGIECLPDGTCKECVPACDGKDCGPDSCGGECGQCADGTTCDVNQKCVAAEDPCAGRVCGVGTDGETLCGTCPCAACAADEVVCSTDGLCEPDEATIGCGGNGCPDIWECINNCPEGDQACINGCINNAPIEGQIAFNDMVSCYSDNIWPCWDLCPEQPEDYNDCPPEAVECFDKGVPVCSEVTAACFHGDYSCLDMWLCFIGCPETDQECGQTCLGCGDLEAQGLWDTFITCLDDNGYFDCADGDSACFEAAWLKCEDSLQACASGDKTCKEVMDCIPNCGPMDQACAQECLYTGSPEGQDAYFALVDCIVEQCGEQANAECEDQAIKGACASLYSECQAGE